MFNTKTNKKGSLGDNYQTPSKNIIPIIKYVDLTQVIWEPACGDGNIVHAFKQANYNIIGSDINDPYDSRDFLKLEDHIKSDYDIIITNPPYSLLTEWLDMCVKLNKPFMLLIPLTSLETEKRQLLFNKIKSDLKIILFNKRIQFENTTNRPTFSTAWFCYKIPLLPDTFTFINL
jgi:hypothetical protein